MTGCPFLLLFYNILRRFSRYENSLLFFFLLFCCLGPLGSLPAEFHLGIYQRFATFVLLLIQTGGLQDMCFYIVTEFQIQHMHDLFLDPLIFHRENNLHTTVKVTWHPIRTSHINFIGTAIAEIENTAVLQEITNDRTHVDIFADTRNAHLQAADAADQKIDPDPTGRSII